MSKSYNPFRCKFSKAPIDYQLKAAKKAAKKDTNLSQIVNELMRIDPVLSICQDGRLKFLTDKHLFA